MGDGRPAINWPDVRDLEMFSEWHFSAITISES
jgi:hypothetical protein